MIDTLAAAIIAHLDTLNIFRVIDLTVTAKALQAPPAAVVFLAYDRRVADKPTVTRELGWDVMLMVPALGIGKGMPMAGSVIDAVRDAFSGWLPLQTGGVLPTEVPEIRLEGIEQTMLVYTVRLTMRVFPQTIK